MTDETKDEGQVQEGQPEQAGPPANKVSVEELEQSRKRVTIEIDRQRIDAKFNEIFGELHRTAMVPGFRIGHAPRRLLEKRYGKEASQDVRNALVAEALKEVDESAKLDILGEPDIELDKIELPEKGNLSFSVDVEVKPQFELPGYKAMAVEEPPLPAPAEQAAGETRRILASRGTLVPTDSPAQAGDQIIADVAVTGEGIEHSAENAELRVAPGAVAGIPLEEMGEKLAGAQAGRTVKITTRVPEGHENEAWRGKDATVAFAIREVKRLELPALDDGLAGEFGFDSAEALRQHIARRAEAQVQYARQQALREQVCRQLLTQTTIDLPAQVTRRHTGRMLQRRLVDLLHRGVPRDQIEQNLELLEAGAGEAAVQDLRLSFILEKIAKAEGIEVAEGEVNTRIAEIAAQQSRRPERLRQEMQSQGTLAEVEVQILEQKTLDKILEMAEVKPAVQKPAAEEPAEEKPAEEKPAEVKPAEEEPAGKKPAAKARSSKGKSAKGKAVEPAEEPAVEPAEAGTEAPKRRSRKKE